MNFVGLHLLAVLAMVPLKEPLTFQCRAMAIPQVLGAISKTTGVKLSAEGEARSEIVLVTVKDVPLQTLMQKIAFVTSCSWKEQGDGYTLAPNNTERKKEERDELRSRADKIRSWLTTRIKVVEEMRGYPVSLEQKGGANVSDADLKAWSKRAFYYDPAERACLQMLSAIGPETLAELPIRQKTVWVTNNPTYFQSEFPYSQEPPISDLVSDRAEIATEGKTGEPIKTAILKAELFIKPLKDELTASLVCYDRDLKSVVGGSAGIRMLFENLGSVSTNDLAKASMDMPPLQLSPQSSQILKMYSNKNGPGSPLRLLEPSLRKQLADVDHTDPLSFFASDVIEYYGTTVRHQVVASLPDEFYSEALEALQHSDIERQESSIVQAVTHGDSLAVRIEEPFALIRPSKPATNRKARFDRIALRPLLVKSQNSGYPRLSEMVNFSVGNGDLSDNPITRDLSSFFWPAYESMDAGSWHALQFIGSLSQEQETALLRGQKLPLASLSEFQRQQVVDSVQHLSPYDNSSEHEEDARDEQSEFLVRGLAKGFVSITKSTSEIVFSDSDQEASYRTLLQPIDYAQQSANLRFGLSGKPRSVPLKAKVGSQETYSLSFDFGGNVSRSSDLNDFTMPTDSPLIPHNQFPTAFLGMEKYLLRERWPLPQQSAPNKTGSP